MKISNTDWPSGQVPDSRRPAAGPRTPLARRPGPAEGAPPQPQQVEDVARTRLRQRILELERSASGLQRALAALEGFRDVLQAACGGVQPPQSAEEYLRAARHRGHPVLAPYAERLGEILQRGDTQGLEGMIADVSEALRSQAAELDRFQTALQNSQAVGLAGPADPLAALVQAVRGAGEQLLQTDAKSALDLLS